MLKFNADGPAGLIDSGRLRGQPPRLNDAHRATLAAIIEERPRSRLFMGSCGGGSSISLPMDLRGIPRRHHLPADPEPGIARRGVIASFRLVRGITRRLPMRLRILKSLPDRLDEIARENGVAPEAIEVWFADEAPTSARRTRSPADGLKAARAQSRSQRSANGLAYIFGAICPKDGGKGAALAMPRCDTEAMNLHLAGNRHPDRAEGAQPRCSSIEPAGICPGGLIVPPTITLIALPAKCP